MAELQEVLQRRRHMEEGTIWASEIAPRLYLGRGQDAANLKQLKNHGITHILNVADDVDNFHSNHFTYLNLNVTDFGGDKGIARVFAQAKDFVESALQRGEANKVLVHCANGSNRSATVAIALLMMLPLAESDRDELDEMGSKTERSPMSQMNLKEAYDLVRRKHSATAPLRDNRMQLVMFEKELRGSNSMAEDDFGKVMQKDR